MRRVLVAGTVAGFILAIPFVMVEVVYVRVLEPLWIPLAILLLAAASVALPQWSPSATPFRTSLAFTLPAVVLAWTLSTGFLMSIGESQLVFASGWYGLKAVLGAVVILFFWSMQAVVFAALGWASARFLAWRSSPTKTSA